MSASNRVGGQRIAELTANKAFLSCQLAANQFPSNSHRHPGLIGKRLSAPQAGIRRANRAGRREHGAIPIKHDECGVLIGQPAQRRK
jgi:hypothetical protein